MTSVDPSTNPSETEAQPTGVETPEVSAEPSSIWPWAVIALPAAPAPVLATRWACQRALDGLTDIVNRTVSLSPDTAGEIENPFEPAFGVTFELAGQPGEGLVALDAQLARLLINAMAPDPEDAAPAGPGPIALPTAGELGLLEFIAIAVVEHVVRSAPDDAERLRLTGFLDGGRVGQWQSKQSAIPSLELSVQAGGQPGCCRLMLPWLSEADIAALQGSWMSCPRETLDLQLAFNPIELTPEAFGSIEPGDVLVVGGCDLASAAGGCSVVTTTGWSLGSAAIASDTPLATSAVLEQACPTPLCFDGGDAVTVLAQFGTCEQSIQVFGDSQPASESIRLTFAKPEESPITLFAQGQALGRGELVTLDNELAIRITDWRPSPNDLSST